MKKPNILQRFFILCSGANREIIYQCPTEWNKYAGIGATILLTGILASISGGYALYTIFRGMPNSLNYAIAFGVLWGFVILNLDRFIVLSIKKEGKVRKELYQSIPRFIIAIIISIVIAKPLEVRMYEDRIQQQMNEDKLKKLEGEKISIGRINGIPTLDNSIAQGASELNNLDKLKRGDPETDGFRRLLEERNTAWNDMNSVSKNNNAAIDGYNAKINQIRADPNNIRIITDSTGRVINRILTTLAAREVNDLAYKRNLLSKEIKTAQHKVQGLDAEIKKERNEYQSLMTKQIEDKRAEIKQTKETKAKAERVADKQFDESKKVKEISYTNNFISQIEALNHLTASEPSMRRTSWLIALLFIVIEIAPVLSKLLSAKGPYDEMLSAAEYAIELEENRKIEELESTIEALIESARKAAEIQAATYLTIKEDELKAQLAQNKDILEKVAAYQKELADKYIDAWYAEEQAKLQGNINNMWQQANAKLEEVFWRQVGTPDKIEYFFRNGSIRDNELIYTENNKLDKGKWSYNTKKDGIIVELFGQTVKYKITELVADKLILQEVGTPEIMEFERV